MLEGAAAAHVQFCYMRLLLAILTAAAFTWSAVAQTTTAPVSPRTGAFALDGATRPVVVQPSPMASPVPQPAATGPANPAISIDQPEALDGNVPITPPREVGVKIRRSAVYLLPSFIVQDRVTVIERDLTDKWWIIPDANAGNIYVLPCEYLDTIEDMMTGSPGMTFSLSGEAHPFRGKYYLLLNKVLLVSRGEKAAAPPPPPPPIVRPPVATEAAPTSRPSAARAGGASAEDVASELFRNPAGRPVVPPNTPGIPDQPAPSVAPVRAAIKPETRNTVAGRLVRVQPQDEDWFQISFESDNTLQEPPLRVLPSETLERLTRLAADKPLGGAVFEISGEIYRYRGVQYLMLRTVRAKREMDQF